MSTHATLGTEAVTQSVSLVVNGTERRLEVDTRTSLLDLLREELGLTGAKKGCDQGQCGACTVLLDGRRSTSCLALAVAHQGAELVTIEGLAGATGCIRCRGRSSSTTPAMRLLYPRADLLCRRHAGRGQGRLAERRHRRSSAVAIGLDGAEIREL